MIEYSLLVTNEGETDLDPVVVTDPLSGLSSISCPETSLDVGEDMTCTATYAITQADLDADVVNNTATATGTAPLGTEVSDEDSETVDLIQSPEITLDKTGSVSGGTTVGDTITYTFEVDNTGNVTLTNVTVTDPLSGLTTIVCNPTQPATLAPNEVMSCSATYDIDQADIDLGKVDNEATATGTPPPEGEDVTDKDPETVDLSPNPSLSVVKTLTGHNDTDQDGLVSLGETLTYLITATNTGNVTLHNVEVTDDKITKTGGTTPCASVVPNGTCTLEGTYVITQGDVDAGKVENTGVADSDETPPTEDPHDEPVEDPAIEVDKSPDGVVDSGQDFTFTIKVTNTGNVDLVSVVVSDVLAPDCDKNIGNLAVGAMTSYTCTVTDIQGLFTNVAEVEAFFGEVKVEDDDSAFVGFISAQAAIGDTVWLDEDGDGIEDAGEPGVANAKVTLYLCNNFPTCDDRTEIATTTTNSNGIYGFTGLAVADYVVVIDTSTVDGDLTTVGEFKVDLASGVEFLNADFGVEVVLPVTGMSSAQLGWFGLVLLASGGMLILGSGFRRREE